MDLRLSAVSVNSPLALRQIKPAAQAEGARVQGPQAGFGEAFKTALQKVSAAQNEASELQTQVQLGNPKVSLEETMLAMQKAQVGFQAALHVRNRMMQAYTDVMNMQV